MRALRVWWMAVCFGAACLLAGRPASGNEPFRTDFTGMVGYLGALGSGTLATDWPVKSAAFSADGKHIYLLHLKLTVWDANTGRFLKQVPSPDGYAVAAISDQEVAVVSNTHEKVGYVSCVDVANGKVTRRIEPLHPVDFNFCMASASKDGRWLAIASKVIQVVDLKHGAVRTIGPVQHNPNFHFIPPSLEFSDDSKTLFWNSGMTDCWRFDMTDPKASPVDVRGVSLSASMTADGKSIVVNDRRLKLLDLATGKELDQTDADVEQKHAHITVPRTSEVYRHVRAAPVGTYVASIYLNRLAIWDTAGSKLRLVREWDVSGDNISELLWSPDATRLLTVNNRGYCTTELWDVASGKRLASNDDSHMHGGCLTASPDGKMIALAGSSGQVSVWSVADRRRVLFWHAPPHGTRNVPARVARFTTEGLWVVPQRGSSVLLDPQSGKLLRQIDRDDIGDTLCGDIPPSGNGLVWAALGESVSVRLDGRQRQKKWHANEIDLGHFLQLLPHAPGFLMVADDRLGAWSFEPKLVGASLDLKVKRNFAYDVSSSPDGRWFAGSFDKSLFDLHQSPRLADAVRRAQPVERLPTFSSTGALYCHVGNEGLRLIDTRTGTELATIPAVRRGRDLILVPRSTVLCVLQSDGVGHLWDVRALLRSMPSSLPVDATDARLWDEAASDDARLSFEAILRLESRGTLRKTMEAVTRDPSRVSAPPREKIREWVELLSSPDRQVVERAHVELERAGYGTMPVINQWLWIEPAGERRARLESISRRYIDDWRTWVGSGDAARHDRACEVLSWSDNPADQKLLADFKRSLPATP